MPAVRNHPDPRTRKRRQCSAELAPLKAELRSKVNTRLIHVTGNATATIGWCENYYARGVVVRRRQNLVGWSRYANIPFANPSDIVGGQPVLRFLLTRWNAGILRFESASDEDVNLAQRNARAVLPGAPPTRPLPLCWSLFGQNNIDQSRFRPVTNPLGRPLRHPKTPKLILDWDIGVDVEDWGG